MLRTNLKHILSASEHANFIKENENAMICCGRMGPMCMPVYSTMELLRDKYPHVQFADMEFDNPEAHVIRDAPECRGFMGLPFTVYYKNGKLMKATSSTQSREQIVQILEQYFSD
jgi:thioredoxin 1